MALVGVEDKLPPEDVHLRRMFVKKMGSYLACELGAGDERAEEALKWIRAAGKRLPRQLGKSLLSHAENNDLNNLRSLDQDLERELLGTANILFATLSTLSKPFVHEATTRRGKCGVLWALVDEAGQAPGADTLPLLTWQPERLLLVGDTKYAYINTCVYSWYACMFVCSYFYMLVCLNV